jgi:hypothetical protein
MSRAYEMQFFVAGFKKEKQEEIIETIQNIWELDGDDIHFDNFWCEANKLILSNGKKLPETYLQVNGTDSLYGGQTEQEFFEMIRRLIWKTNENYCYFEINAIQLEDLPYEKYETDPNDYEIYLKDLKCQKQ